MTYICVSELEIIGSDDGLSAPSQYLNWCWDITNLTIGNSLQWNVDMNWYIFVQGNSFENVVCEMVAILFSLIVLTHILV